MSFLVSKDYIEDGDTIFLYSGIKTTNVIKVERGKVTQIKFGAVRHDDLIGTKFGRKYKCAKGTIVILSPTSELWSVNLPHRTQILYATDISMIISLLYLQPGFKVIEAGTGSGSLSHSIIRTVYPTGHLYTFDFHEERVKLANEEFKEHKLDSYVTCKQKDVCKDGFGLENCVDAVFLDLPRPWEAIPFAYDALKTKGATRICCFSPCIEQVQKTVESLQLRSFIDIQTIECLNRPYEIKGCNWKSLNLNDAPDNQTILNENDESLDKKNGENLKNVNLESDIINEDDNLDTNDNKRIKNDKHFVSAIPLNKIPGHTGFLTFATKL